MTLNVLLGENDNNDIIILNDIIISENKEWNFSMVNKSKTRFFIG